MVTETGSVTVMVGLGSPFQTERDPEHRLS